MKKITQFGLVIAAAVLTFACSKPGETVETSDALEVTAGAGDTLSLNTTASTIGWTGYKPSGKHFGKIPATEGMVTVVGDSITGGTFTFAITGLTIEDLAQTDESYGKLFGHLQSADFFDATTFPTAKFEITGVTPFQAGDQIADKAEFSSDFTPSSDSVLTPANPTHWISGNLTMRGTTKNIKFPSVVSVSNGSLNAKAGFNIDRTAWGLMYGDESGAVDKAKDKFIYNTVSLVLDVTAN